MLDLITQNPVVSFLLALVPVTAAVWKVLHELYVKPRDFRIDSLKDEMARLNHELDHLNQSSPPPLPTTTPRSVSSEVALSATPVVANAVLSVPPIVDGSNPNVQQSPLSSLKDCYEKWRDPSRTELQKQRFEKDLIGQTARWDVVVESVSEASHGKIVLYVKDGDVSRFDAPRGAAWFTEQDEPVLLDLKKGDRVTVEGRIREFFLFPGLDSATLTRRT